ncbi:MAG: hypothetical protein WDO70_01800 [Alphaproteobacteria bacterium]
MQRLQTSLTVLDRRIADLEQMLEVRQDNSRRQAQQQTDALKTSRAREANALALAQKIAARLDQAIERVEHVLRD